MHKRNWRFVFTGVFFLIIAVFFFTIPLAENSTNPQAFREIIGQVTGVAGGVSVALILIGLIGKNLRSFLKQQPSQTYFYNQFYSRKINRMLYFA